MEAQLLAPGGSYTLRCGALFWGPSAAATLAQEAQLVLLLDLARHPGRRPTLLALLQRGCPDVPWGRLTPMQWGAALQTLLRQGRLQLFCDAQATAGAVAPRTAAQVAQVAPPAPGRAAPAPHQEATTLQLYVGVNEQPYEGPVVLQPAAASGDRGSQVLRSRGGPLAVPADRDLGPSTWQLWDLLAAARQGRLDAWGSSAPSKGPRQGG